MSQWKDEQVLIVGGGIGGLAAALALERRGAETIICEQSPALSEVCLLYTSRCV